MSLYTNAHKNPGSSSFVIISTVRNVEKSFTKDFLRLNKAFDFASKLYWIIVESDSTDNTRQVIQNHSMENANLFFISLGELASTKPHRTIRIAHSRNVALEFLRKNLQNLCIDYIVLADLDGRNRHITSEAILSSFEIPGWDVCTANQDGIYYDIWGLRHEIWSPDDCWTKVFELEKQFALELAIKVCVTARQIRVPIDTTPFQVQSAFGGLAIYRKDVLVNRIYLERLLNGREVCDHVPVNLEITSEGYKIFMNPKMINYREQKFIEYLKKFVIVQRFVKKLREYRDDWKLLI